MIYDCKEAYPQKSETCLERENAIQLEKTPLKLTKGKLRHIKI